MKFGKLDIIELLELMKKFELTEISLKRGRFSVELKKNQAFRSIGSQPEPVFLPDTLIMGSDDAGKKDRLSEIAPPQIKEDPKVKLIEIKTPLVGTFYRAPAPEAEPFVEVGHNFKRGDTLCIVEAMKNMNEIQAEMDGIIAEICPDNGQLVEFDQVLFRVEETTE